ncbi:MAG: hypothetical protein MK102_09440 [Fuerstiella sp.]|nr:hypothetical protein [Fuerstiella sp.]
MSFCLPVIIGCLIMACSAAEAGHPISVTETHVFVTQRSARARIQLFAEDLLLFQQLEPDSEGKLSEQQLQRGLEQHRDFLTERVTIRDADGILIPSKVTDVVPFEIPAEGIPEEDLMLYSATYELEFQFDNPPEFLTFQQDITDENFILPSEMKLTIHQTGSGNVIAGILQPGSAVTHRFDWESPLSPSASDDEYKSWLQKQRQDTLGITSYSSVYSFIYIEPGEVRHEILIPLASLASVLSIERADPAFLEIAEQEAATEQVRDWLAEVNPTRINGADVETEFSRIDFYGLNLRDFARQAEVRRVSFASGRVGIILRYLPAENFVSDVELSWDTFHSSIRKVRSVVIPWSGQIERFEFSRFKTRDDNIFRWSADAADVPGLAEPVFRELPEMPRLRVPLASCALIVCALFVPLLTTRRWQVTLACLVLAVVCWPIAGTEVSHPTEPIPRLSSERARGIAERLHSGTYQSLDFGTERRIYSALEQFVDGQLLESLYLQLRDGLAVREQGGAVSRVSSIEYVDGALSESSQSSLDWPGFSYRSTWIVAGTVEHWGHVHERRNRFSAVLNIEPRGGWWKITKMHVDSQESLSGVTSLRKFQD